MQKILIKNIKGLVQAGEDIPLIRKGKDMQELPIVKNAFLYLEDNEVIAYGKMDDWKEIGSSSDIEIIDAEGCFVLPAFCDSHTHTVFAKTREEEFVDRIHGMSYEEIALKGGGILNSAAKLAEMSEEELFNSAQERIQKMIACGTGAIEIKSGYGLSVAAELKMLRVIKKLKATNKIEIKATFLGAHAFPLAYKENHRGYIDLIINELLPLIAKEKLAEYIDVFCEKNYFSVDEMAEIISAGKEYGLIPKVHVNQFTILGGVKKAIDLGALSVDHLEEIDEEDIGLVKVYVVRIFTWGERKAIPVVEYARVCCLPIEAKSDIVAQHGPASKVVIVLKPVASAIENNISVDERCVTDGLKKKAALLVDNPDFVRKIAQYLRASRLISCRAIGSPAWHGGTVRVAHRDYTIFT
jgi:imidazolonepropionase